MRNLHCTFARLSVPLQVVTHEGKRYGTMHLIQHYSNDLTVPQKFFIIKILTIGVAKIFDWVEGGRNSCAMTASEIFKRWHFYGTEIP